MATKLNVMQVISAIINMGSNKSAEFQPILPMALWLIIVNKKIPPIQNKSDSLFLRRR
jgi:hypothetical protein